MSKPPVTVYTGPPDEEDAEEGEPAEVPTALALAPHVTQQIGTIRSLVKDFRRRQLGVGIAALEVTEAAQAYSFNAIAVIVNIMNDVSQRPPLRLRAAEVLLNRAFGKPVSADKNDPQEMSDAELEAAALAVLRDRGKA